MEKKKFILAIQNKFYQIFPPKKTEENFFYYPLKIIPNFIQGNFFLQKIIFGYPSIKTFLPAIPTPQKSEQKNVVSFFFPQNVFQKNVLFFQPFSIADKSTRFAFYSVLEDKLKNKFSFFSRTEPLVSFFLKKYLKSTKTEKNLAFYFDSEIIFIKKYFSDVLYFPNSKNLPFQDFLLAVKENTSFKVEEAHFFVSETKVEKNLLYSKERAFFPHWKDFLPSKPKIIKWNRKTKKKQLENWIFTGITALLFFSSLGIIYSFYSIAQLENKLASFRKVQAESNTIEETRKLFIEGKKVFQNNILQEIVKKKKFLPQQTLQEIEKLLTKDAWLVFFQQNDNKITFTLASLDVNFMKKNKTRLEKLLKSKIITKESKIKEGIAYFSLEIN